MILLSSVIDAFKSDLLAQYKDQLLPSHHKALKAMQACRNDESPLMKAGCAICFHELVLPHSCGHRN